MKANLHLQLDTIQDMEAILPILDTLKIEIIDPEIVVNVPSWKHHWTKIYYDGYWNDGYQDLKRKDGSKIPWQVGVGTIVQRQDRYFSKYIDTIDHLLHFQKFERTDKEGAETFEEAAKKCDEFYKEYLIEYPRKAIVI